MKVIVSYKDIEIYAREKDLGWMAMLHTSVYVPIFKCLLRINMDESAKYIESILNATLEGLFDRGFNLKEVSVVYQRDIGYRVYFTAQAIDKVTDEVVRFLYERGFSYCINTPKDKKP